MSARSSVACCSLVGTTSRRSSTRRSPTRLACLILWQSPTVWTALLQIAVLVFSLEYCLYNARYQFNDVRGFVEDDEHAYKNERRRLPHGTVAEDRRTIAVSLLVVVARVGLAFATPVTFGVASAAQAGVVVGAIVAATLVYEASRSWEDALGRRPQDGRANVRRLVVAIVWLNVLVGYVIRFGSGLALGGLPLDAPLTYLLLVTIAALAAITVFVTWALEAHGNDAHEKRPHIVAMRRFVPSARKAGDPSDNFVKWLAAGSSPLAPWNLALVIGGACAAVTGASALAYPRFDAPVGAIAGALVGSGLIAVATTRWRRWAGTALGASIILLAGRDLCALAAAAGFAIVATTYNMFVWMSYDDTQAAVQRAIDTVSAFLYTALRRRPSLCSGGRRISGCVAAIPSLQTRRTRAEDLLAHSGANRYNTARHGSVPCPAAHRVPAASRRAAAATS